MVKRYRVQVVMAKAHSEGQTVEVERVRSNSIVGSSVPASVMDSVTTGPENADDDTALLAYGGGFCGECHACVEGRIRGDF